MHIPFCQRRCTYCDFNIVVGKSPEQRARYMRALYREWEQLTPPQGRLVSIFFGGGTPSLVEPEAIGTMVQAIVSRMGCPSEALEITLEANPGTLTEATLAGYRRVGVNRLSLGVQAMQSHHLAALHRLHGPQDAVNGVHWARRAGFANVSLDAIYGLPGQTLAEWRETLEALLRLEPDHLSLYQLMIEEGTPLGRGVARGAVPLPDPDLIAEMGDLAVERLAKAGLERYEISNFARPGCASIHNRLYWRLAPYVGLGAGAHGYAPGTGEAPGVRRWNHREWGRYLALIEGGQSPTAGEEILGRDEEMREFLWLGLREMSGIRWTSFRERFGVSGEARFGAVLEKLAGLGLVVPTAEGVRLSERGADVASVVARELLDA